MNRNVAALLVVQLQREPERVLFTRHYWLLDDFHPMIAFQGTILTPAEIAFPIYE